MSNELRNFLALPYDELQELNLKAKEQRKNRIPLEFLARQHLRRTRQFPQRGVDDGPSGGRRKGPLRGPEASLRRSLPEIAGKLREGQEVQFHQEVYNQFLWNQF